MNEVKSVFLKLKNLSKNEIEEIKRNLKMEPKLVLSCEAQFGKVQVTEVSDFV